MDKRTRELMHSSGKDDWETPPELFDLLDQRFHFTIDVCADDINHKCKLYFTEQDNALIQDWGKHTCWMNPPYSRGLGPKFIRKARAAAKAGATVVCLLAARPDTQAWQDDILGWASEITFLRGRIKFVGADYGAPFPSAVVVFTPQSTVRRKPHQMVGWWDWKSVVKINRSK